MAIRVGDLIRYIASSPGRLTNTLGIVTAVQGNWTFDNLVFKVEILDSPYNDDYTCNEWYSGKVELVHRRP